MIQCPPLDKHKIKKDLLASKLQVTRAPRKRPGKQLGRSVTIAGAPLVTVLVGGLFVTAAFARIQSLGNVGDLVSSAHAGLLVTGRRWITGMHTGRCNGIVSRLGNLVIISSLIDHSINIWKAEESHYNNINSNPKKNQEMYLLDAGPVAQLPSQCQHNTWGSCWSLSS